MAVRTYRVSSQGNQTIAGTRFTPRDFQCKNGADEVKVDTNLAVLLQAIENHFGGQVTITSGYRTASYNAGISGAANNSQHVQGRAADISIPGVALYDIARYADYKMGQKGGVGCYTTRGNNFVHVDTRGTAAYWEDEIWRSRPYRGDSSDPPLNLDVDNTASGSVESPHYTSFPKYHLSDSAINDIATMITGEQGGSDELACRQEASQLANLNEVTRGRSCTEESILKTLHSGWYAQSSWSRGVTQTAIEAVKFVLVDGKRVLPRYVTEHDTFPLDILNAQSRNEYVTCQTQVRNKYGSNYIFYCFFGSGNDKDIAGFFQKDYDKYKSDIPWSEATSGASSGSEKTKITKSRIVNETGGRGAVRENAMAGKKTLGGRTELYIINHQGAVLYPAVEGDISLEQYRKDAPSKLAFNLVKTPELDFKEGAQVVLKYGGVEMFYGFVFSKSRNKGSMLKCTAYDQLRYLKNKDCYVYSDKTATELIKMIAGDYNLVCGDMLDTGYKIPLRVEDNATLFDIIQSAFDVTCLNTGEMYVLYDEFGKLRVRKPKEWIYDIVVDDETALDLDYQTSIDSDVSTRIKLYHDNDKSGEREVYIYNNEEKINEWGVLQYCDKLEDEENGVEKAELLSQIYGLKSRTLTIKDAFGNPDVRGGCSVYVDLDLGDVVQKHFMFVESVKHKIGNGKYTMDLTVRGGEFTE